MHDRIDTSACESTGWFDPPLEVMEPESLRAPIVFSSPHSGRLYPQPFVERSCLDRQRLRKSEDCFVDEIFSDVVALGVPWTSRHDYFVVARPVRRLPEERAQTA